MPKLNTVNPESLIYQNELLKLTVLGGIKLEGLDRMRATLKIELLRTALPAVRHNLDLYNDSQVEKLIRKTAERLEVGTSVISASLAELTEQLEQYRLDQIKQSQPQAPAAPVVSAEERARAEAFLRNERLLERTNELIGQSGVIGEELNRLLMYLIFTSRKREQPLHVISLGSSGTGKTHLQEKVGSLVPDEEKVEITTLSENAFYYFGQRELKHRLILIEDLDGAENVLYPMRELMSKRRISKTIAHKTTKGETKTIHLLVEGPVSVAGCTTRESIYEDNANRSFLLYLDESASQDARIMGYQRALSAGKVNREQEEKAAALLRNCQRLLEPIKVVNPYAELLEIPREVFKPRRSNAHYLAFIELVTFYHQHQREQKADPATGELYIETTLEDIAAANKLMKEVLLRKSDELSGACRNYFERLKSWLKEEAKTAFTNAQARTALRENHSNQKRYMIQLQTSGFLRKTKGDKKHGYYYEVVSMGEYEQLRSGVANVLDNIFLKVEQVVQSSKEVHRPSEPLPAKPTAESTKKFDHNEEGRKGIEKNEVPKLPEHLERYLEELSAYLQTQGRQTFTNRELLDRGLRSKSQLKAYHPKLIKTGHIAIISGQPSSGYTYQIARR